VAELSHSGYPLTPEASPALIGVCDRYDSLDEVLRRMYDSEINFLISAFWDAGYLVALGDRANGFRGHAYVDNAREIAGWFTLHVEEFWPTSAFAAWVRRRELETQARSKKKRRK